MKPYVPLTTAAAALFLLASCAQNADLVPGSGYLFKTDTHVATARDQVSTGSWDVPTGLTGAHVIEIDTHQQIARYFIGGHVVGYSTISSGTAGRDTPKGTFSVISKDISHKSSTYGSVVDSAGNVLVESYTKGQPMPAGGRYQGAPMNFGLQLTTSGIWMHEGAVTSAPESHGCIRLPRKMAKIFFENTSVGDKVIIK